MKYSAALPTNVLNIPTFEWVEQHVFVEGAQQTEYIAQTSGIISREASKRQSVIENVLDIVQTKTSPLTFSVMPWPYSQIFSSSA